MKFGIFFRNAGATGHVFLMKNGKPVDEGRAYSGFIGPWTTVAVVPSTAQIIPFIIDAQTSDKQIVKVTGSLTVTLEPAIAVKLFDFTVDTKDGGYLGSWQRILNAKVTEGVLRAVLKTVRNMTVEEAMRSQEKVEEEILKASKLETPANKDGASLVGGIIFNSCSISKIKPSDEEVEGAIGANERQTMLTNADKALHDRQLKAAENERAVGKYEADTKLELEVERAKLIAQQGTNKEKEAHADALATKIRLAVLGDVDAGKLLGAAIMKVAESGGLGTLVIGPELLGALQKK